MNSEILEFLTWSWLSDDLDECRVEVCESEAQTPCPTSCQPENSESKKINWIISARCCCFKFQVFPCLKFHERLRIGRGTANKSGSSGWVFVIKFYLWGLNPTRGLQGPPHQKGVEPSKQNKRIGSLVPHPKPGKWLIRSGYILLRPDRWACPELRWWSLRHLSRFSSVAISKINRCNKFEQSL